MKSFTEYSNCAMPFPLIRDSDAQGFFVDDRVFDQKYVAEIQVLASLKSHFGTELPEVLLRFDAKDIMVKKLRSVRGIALDDTGWSAVKLTVLESRLQGGIGGASIRFIDALAESGGTVWLHFASHMYGEDVYLRLAAIELCEFDEIPSVTLYASNMMHYTDHSEDDLTVGSSVTYRPSVRKTTTEPKVPRTISELKRYKQEVLKRTGRS